VVSGAQLSVPKSQREIPLWRASTTCLPCRSRIRTPETLSAITSRRGPELLVDQGLQRVTERVLGINRPCEPSLAQLDGAYESSRSFRGAVSEREVRVLIPLANQLPQVPRAKTVLRDDPVPDIDVFLEVGRHARWHVRSGFHTESFSQGRPQIAPLENVTVSDVERLVRRLG